MLLRIPDASIVKPYIGRGIRLWIILRIAVAVVGALAGGVPASDVARWTLAGAAGVLAACALLGFIDTRRRGERVLLANLGVAEREVVALFVVAALAGEMLLALVLPR